MPIARSRLFTASIALLLGLVACGGEDAPPDGTDASVGVDSGGGGTDSGTRDAGGGTDAGFDAAVATDAGTDAGASDVDAGACPDLNGQYDLMSTGMCGDLNNMPVEQRIDGRLDTCVFRPEYRMMSLGVGGSFMANAAGATMGAAITLGSGMYTCDGVWNPATSVYTLTCTATGGLAACVVTMTRTGPL